MPSEQKAYDVVIFGASGFTGEYVVEEVARSIDEEQKLKWAIAGRNMAKLQATLKRASKTTGKELEDIPIIIADINSDESLLAMCKASRVILNCVGPYRFFGAQMVRACIEGGAHHLDISGEPQYLEKMQFLYDSKAREVGVYIVGACGWDSIPAEMGVVYTRNNFQGDLNGIESFVSTHSGPQGGHFHFGTWQSAIHGLAHSGELPGLRKQLYPSSAPKPQHRLPKRNVLFWSDVARGWCLPFLGSDKSVVYRSQRYNESILHERMVQFNPYMRVSSLFQGVLMLIFGAFFFAMTKFKCGRYLLEKFPRFFSAGTFSHEGPTKQQVEQTSFTMTFVGTGYATKLSPGQQHEDKPDKTVKTKVHGPEPGYIATPICLVQAAYVLLAEPNKLPKGGGVFPPGAAFQKTTLIERLNRHGVTFQVLQE